MGIPRFSETYQKHKSTTRATAIEYALIAALIVVMIVGMLHSLESKKVPTPTPPVATQSPKS